MGAMTVPNAALLPRLMPLRRRVRLTQQRTSAAETFAGSRNSSVFVVEGMPRQVSFAYTCPRTLPSCLTGSPRP